MSHYLDLYLGRLQIVVEVTALIAAWVYLSKNIADHAFLPAYLRGQVFSQSSATGPQLFGKPITL